MRIGKVNKIAKAKRNITPSLRPRAYLRLVEVGADPGRLQGREDPDPRRLPLPATYEFTEDTRSRALVADQLEAFDRAWEDVDLAYAKSKNLTAYEVLIIASMIEKGGQVPRERPLVAAVIYNRLKLGMALGIDATIRYGLGVPATESPRESQLLDPEPVQHPPPRRPPAHADRQPGARLDPGGGSSGEGELPLLRTERGLQEPLLHRERGGARLAHVAAPRC